MVIGTRNQGLFRSTNGGTSWQQVGQFATANVRDVWLSAPAGQTGLAATFGNGLLRSTNSGQSWAAVGQNIGTALFYSFASAGNTIFVGTADRGVWKSTNEGAAWQAPTGISR